MNYRKQIGKVFQKQFQGHMSGYLPQFVRLFISAVLLLFNKYLIVDVTAL